MITNDEIGYQKWVYGYEIRWKKYKFSGELKTWYVLHRFATKYERGVWFQEGNRKPLDHPEIVNKRRNRVAFYHP
jgi:hypothetical protein